MHLWQLIQTMPVALRVWDSFVLQGCPMQAKTPLHLPVAPPPSPRMHWRVITATDRMQAKPFFLPSFLSLFPFASIWPTLSPWGAEGRWQGPPSAESLSDTDNWLLTACPEGTATLRYTTNTSIISFFTSLSLLFLDFSPLSLLYFFFSFLHFFPAWFQV